MNYAAKNDADRGINSISYNSAHVNGHVAVQIREMCQKPPAIKRSGLIKRIRKISRIDVGEYVIIA